MQHQSTQQTPPPLAGIRYPTAGLSKLFFRTPVVLWRMGLGRLLPRNFLVLTTSGRKSGIPRHTMVEHWELDDDYYFTSGWGKNAQWYKNLLADPIVTIQTTHHGAVTAEAALVQDDALLTRFYNHAAGTSPFWKPYLDSVGIDYSLDDFLAKKDRVTVVRAQPVEAIGPSPLRTDLVGVWVLAGLALLWLLGNRR